MACRTRLNLVGYTVADGCPASSIIEHGDESDTTLDPVSLGVAAQHWEPDHADEVGRVTGRRQSTEALKCLVDRAFIAVGLDLLSARLHPDEWHLGEEHLRLRLFKSSLLFIPTAAFEEHTVDVGTIWSLSLAIELRINHDFVVPLDLIDGDRVLSGVVLLETSQETLGEEETGDPVVGRLAFLDPLFNEVQTLDEIDNVTRQRLQRWVGTLGPSAWDLVVEQGVADFFELRTHDDFTFNGQFDVLERASDDAE